MIYPDLKNKHVLITGAGGILGRVFAEDFAKNGCALTLVDIHSETIDELAHKLIQKYGINCISQNCDISKESDVEALIKHSTFSLGDIHILHNNAASKGGDLNDFFESFENYKLETWKNISSVNIDGMFLMAKHVGRHMKERNIKGSIIQTASIYGVVAPDKSIYEGSLYMDRPINTPAVYSATKAAVIGLTKHLATYWGDIGIRVNTLSPGGVESGQNEIFKNNYSKRVPLGRMADSAEISQALLFLASDASSYVTGQNMVVDGGLSVW